MCVRFSMTERKSYSPYHVDPTVRFHTGQQLQPEASGGEWGFAVLGFAARGTFSAYNCFRSAVRPCDTTAKAMTKSKVIALFDVDGTLSLPRKVWLAVDARMCGTQRERVPPPMSHSGLMCVADSGSGDPRFLAAAPEGAGANTLILAMPWDGHGTGTDAGTTFLALSAD